MTLVKCIIVGLGIWSELDLEIAKKWNFFQTAFITFITTLSTDYWCWQTVQSVYNQNCNGGLPDNSPTNQLAASEVADWSTRRLDNSDWLNLREQICKYHIWAIIFSNFVSNISASWPVRDLTDHELVCRQIVQLPNWVISEVMIIQQYNLTSPQFKVHITLSWICYVKHDVRTGCTAYWTIRQQTNSVKSQTGQLADSDMFKITKRLQYTCVH